MANKRQQQLEALLLGLLPDDHSTVGNITLLPQFLEAAQAGGISPPASEDDFKTTRESLVASGQAVKGKGRGGATARATGAERPAFDLNAPVVPVPASPQASKQTKAQPPKAKAASPDAGEPQVLAYRYADRRKNNPEVGLVNEARDPQQPKTVWAYDPHLDPALQFDSARAGLENTLLQALAEGAEHTEQQRGETLAWLDHALAGSDEKALREVISNLRQRLSQTAPITPERKALEALQTQGAPYLQWTGKAERTSFEVDTVSLHVHERIDAMSILSAAAKRKDTKDQKTTAQGFQPGLFEAPFESVPLRIAMAFYKHDRDWANRLVAGDSLLVMNSLLHKEGMAGQVQMIYIDPPYGIKYGSNFQPFIGQKKVEDQKDADLTQEPEMIKAFRDTWELGIHSYLAYLRDRLLLAKDLLSDTGSIFIQISDENLHYVRNVASEIFGESNFVSIITVKKTGGQTSTLLSPVSDYLIWYAKDIKRIKYRQPLREMRPGEGSTTGERYDQALLPSGRAIPASRASQAAESVRFFRNVTLSSNRPAKEHEIVSFEFHGNGWFPPNNRTWTTNQSGFDNLAKANRVFAGTSSLNYKKFLDDFPANPLGNLWDDLAGASDKVYVVQTNARIIERCMLMTTDPGDLVLDPTCGSGTTAYVAEKWGRRWITCDTSRVAITLAKQRLMTASFDYFALRYPNEGLRGGFIYKTVPHVTLKSIANNVEIDAIYARMHPAVDAALAALNKALKAHPPAMPYPVAEGVRRGQKLVLGIAGQDLLEWEVPFDPQIDWDTELHAPMQAFHTARQKMQAEMDRTIANNAENETLYDQPERDKNKLRVSGTFTVEAVPFPTVLSLEEHESQKGKAPEADLMDASVARSGHTSRQHTWRDELLKTGIRGKGGQMLRFAELEVLPGTTCLHASGTLDTGERVVVSFGPEHGALETRQVGRALGEAETLRPSPMFIIFCAFTFDPEAAKDIDETLWTGMTLLKAQMNTDLLTEDLKTDRKFNRMRPSMARVLGLETRSTQAV
jgi:adenine-specific DNA-methyltransferase